MGRVSVSLSGAQEHIWFAQSDGRKQAQTLAATRVWRQPYRAVCTGRSADRHEFQTHLRRWHTSSKLDGNHTTRPQRRNTRDRSYGTHRHRQSVPGQRRRRYSRSGRAELGLDPHRADTNQTASLMEPTKTHGTGRTRLPNRRPFIRPSWTPSVSWDALCR